jgi:hypothetical protein
MGSTERVRRFLEASEAHKHYEGIVEYALSYFVARAAGKGNDRFADDLRRLKREYKEEFAQAIGLTEEVYAEHFSDEELDDLIFLHSNPAIKKSRDLNSEIMSKILEKYLQLSGLSLAEHL